MYSMVIVAYIHSSWVTKPHAHTRHLPVLLFLANFFLCAVPFPFI